MCQGSQGSGPGAVRHCIEQAEESQEKEAQHKENAEPIPKEARDIANPIRGSTRGQVVRMLSQPEHGC